MFSGDFFQSYGIIIGLGILLVIVLMGIGWEVKKQIRSRNVRKVRMFKLIDIHTHILPGVDDGSHDIETTINMIEYSYAQGVRAIIATPHYAGGRKRKSPKELQEILQTVKQEVSAKCPGIKLYLGNELLYSHSMVEYLKEGRALTLADSQYVLVEFHLNVSWNTLFQAVLTLLRARYIPIIAHAERYEIIIKNKLRLKELHHTGALLQINVSSIKKCKGILKKGYIDFLATDCHDMKQRKPDMQKGLRWLYRNCNPLLVQKILVENPNRILKYQHTISETEKELIYGNKADIANREE